MCAVCMHEEVVGRDSSQTGAKPFLWRDYDPLEAATDLDMATEKVVCHSCNALLPLTPSAAVTLLSSGIL